MAVKTITITKEAYEVLKGMKNKEESFSKTIIRLMKGREDIRNYFGRLKLNEKELEEVRRKVTKTRKEISDSMEKRVGYVRSR